MPDFTIFCLSFIFLFLTIGFFVRHNQNMSLKKGLTLAFFLILLYFSHVTITIFAISFLYLFLVWQIFLENELLTKEKFKLIFKNSISLLLVCLPVLIFIFFYSRLHTPEIKFEYLSTSSLLKMLFNISPLVGHGPGEFFYTRIYLFILTFLIAFFLVKKYWYDKIKFKLKKKMPL